MLNVYSAEEGRFYYQYSRLDLKQLLHEITRREKLEPENRNKEFELDIDDAVPKIDADPYKLKLALGSIIDNAFRYTPSGGLIKVGVETEAKEILIKIKDTGIGIPDELQLKVFSKFFRADNAISLQPEGNGLDLFVAKRIIEGHGGKIWFKSKVKQGTTFYISLPLKPTHTAKE
jgi:signal transduction histidine kinase